MATTMTGTSKSSATTMNPQIKVGSGWDYDDSNVTYDGATATIDGVTAPVSYDSFGTAPVMTGQAKSSATTMTPSTKS